MNKYLKMIVFGFLIWLLPFVIGFLFYNPQGQLMLDALVFKSVMAVVGAIAAATFLVLYFNKVDRNHLAEGVMVGLVWLVINLLLDILVLVPMAKMSMADYFNQIGLSYLTIPVFSIAIGLAARSASARR